MNERAPRNGGTGAHYERSDVSVIGIVLSTIGLVVGSALALALMAWMFLEFEKRAAAAEAERIPPTRVSEPLPEHPPKPVLQAAPGSSFELRNPAIEMQDWRRQEQELLESSGWVDRNNGIVRIPVERAKQLLLERGLPVRERPPDGAPAS